MLTLEKLNSAFDLWVKITGQSMDTSYFNSQYHNYSVYSANETIEGSFKLDPTLKLPLLLLDYYADQYFKDQFCSLKSLVYNRKEILEEVDLYLKMLDILRDEELENIKKEILEVFKKIQIEYQLNPESLKIFEDQHELSFLYRDSLWSMENLHLYKFSLPDGVETPTNAPKLVKSIHEFENPTALIDFMSRSVNCIVVGYFPNPKIGFEYSSFAFAFRRGKEVLLLTDLKKWSHPLQESMTRRAHPDRHLDAKQGASHFPYYTLQDITAPVENNEIKSLVISNSGKETGFPKTLAYINQLDPIESYWLTFVAGLIHDKFYTKQFIVEEEATTGYSITNQRLLLPAESGKLSDPQEVVHAAVKAGLCGSHPKGQFEWMEKRYGHTVKKELLFLQKYSEDGLLAPVEPTNINLITDGKEKEKAIVPTIGDTLGLKAFNLGRIGTVAELNADRAFLARYNEAQMIEKAAFDEFDQKHDEIYKWYVDHVKANVKNLLKNIANLSMPVENGVILHHSEESFDLSNKEKPKTIDNIMQVYDEVAEKAGCWITGAGVSVFSFGRYTPRKHWALVLDNRKERSYNRFCYVTWTENPQICVTFSVQNANAIAAMAGVSYDDLPEVLKHRRKYEKYVGNSILNRIDPMEWSIEDPWADGIDFNVMIWISRSAFNSLRKQYGLPSKKFWLEEKKKDEMTVVKDEGITRASLS